jgi:hypothetical protein
VTLATFRTMFPELATAPDALVNQFLSVASNAIDVDVFGDRFDEAHGYLTAHLLCLSPYGKNARLQSDKGGTTYGTRFEQIGLAVAGGFRVI